MRLHEFLAAARFEVGIAEGQIPEEDLGLLWITLGGHPNATKRGQWVVGLAVRRAFQSDDAWERYAWRYCEGSPLSKDTELYAIRRHPDLCTTVRGMESLPLDV